VASLVRARPLCRTRSSRRWPPVDEAPAGDDWLHEVKFDGYRILAAIEG